MKSFIKPLLNALYNFEPNNVAKELQAIFLTDANIQLAYPFEQLEGTKGLLNAALLPLYSAFPDLERRDMILMSGTSNGNNWVGCMGYYTGTFNRSWLDIPATGQQAAMRFHEFYRFADNKIVEMQALWDIPELMMQANAWPMAPSLGRDWQVPAPATQDGIIDRTFNFKQSEQALDLVGNMLQGLGKFAEGGVEAMQLEKYWHPNFRWYGPAGIGTSGGITGFRNWHQIPFLNAMPDRVADPDKGHFFSDNNYVGFTAWPGMHMTISSDGWLGIAPSDKKITMRSLDFWRCENTLIRENWVLIDLLHVYHQVGVDVLARMREFNKRFI